MGEQNQNPPQEESAVLELFNTTGSDITPALLEQYKLYVETTNGTSATRLQSNSFFLTINTALIGFIVGVVELSTVPEVPWWIICVCVAGIVLCVSWYTLLTAYRNLNSVRFKIIQGIEDKLPANIYAYEWEQLKNRPERPYQRHSRIEQRVPVVFGILYLVIVALLVVT